MLPKLIGFEPGNPDLPSLAGDSSTSNVLKAGFAIVFKREVLDIGIFSQP
jgi:hypothetical protein